MQLSIIIVNYKVRHFTEQCLQSVLNAVKGIEAELFVVDNASGDGSVEYLQPLFPSVHFISNQQNLGFSKANNQALALCKGAFVLFLNPDTLVPEDCLDKCLSYIQSQPGAGALGVRMLDGSGKFLPESKRSFPAAMVAFWKMMGLASLFPKSRLFNRYALGSLDEHQNHTVEVLAGAFILVRKELLLQLNGFDETYFLYGEDIDLSYRIQKAGFDNLYFAETQIIHFKGESSAGTKFLRLKFFYLAMLVFVQKHYRTGSGKLFSGFLQIAIALRAAVSAVHKIISPVLLPIADSCIVWLSLWLIKTYWIQIIRNGKEFGIPFVAYALPIFSVLFVLSAALAGLYDKRYRISKTLVSLVFAEIVMLAAYALLPENIRFSRGVILWGGVFGAVSVLLFRNLSGHQQQSTEAKWLIVASAKEYEEIKPLLEKEVPDQQLMGRVSFREKSSVVCDIKDLSSLIKKLPHSKIIFCIGRFSLREILDQIQILRHKNCFFLFHISGTKSMVGSDTVLPGNDLQNPFAAYSITHSYQQRMKRLIDIKMSLIFLISFPFHLLLHKHSLSFLRNAVRVLVGGQTWVGYATEGAGLPFLKNGVICSLGNKQLVPQMLWEKADRRYAINYDWWQDLTLIFQNYKRLG